MTIQLENMFSKIFEGVVEQNKFDKGFEDGLQGIITSDQDAEYKKAYDLAQEFGEKKSVRHN